MCLSTLICYPRAYSISLTQLYPHYILAQILEFWVTCGVKMMWLCHGWGWQPTQTASHLHIGHIQSVWAHWYAVHMHMVAALHSYTHPTWARFLGSWSLVESKWCHYSRVDADSHLKLLPTSILDITKCLSPSICCPLAYDSSLTQLYPPYFAQILGYVVTCGVKMNHFSHGWGWQPPQTASHIHIRHY
jgi:hypothetical protein